MDQTEKKRKGFDDLVELSRRLRSPEGCPWDREQTLASLKGYIIEEAYEVVEAIESGDADELKEEVGDLLYQTVFVAQIAAEEGLFDAADVVDALYWKLVRRHPHVFGDATAANADEALRIWQGQKSRDKERNKSIVDIPRSMPALVRAQRVGEKASHVGFDWSKAEDAVAKLKEEVGELERAMAAGDADQMEREWGDALFALVNVARHLGIDAERAAHRAVDRFADRFKRTEAKARAEGKEMDELTPHEMDRLWREVKAEEG